MTENEAIKWQKSFKKTYNGFPPETEEACNMAIKALEEIQQYREIGTVAEIQSMKDRLFMVRDMCKDYYEIGTIEEFKDLKVENSELHNEVQAINANMSLFEQEIRNMAIDEFAEKLKDLIAKNVEDAESSNDFCCEIFQSEIDEIAERMKGGE